jgi:hypothetical protein
MIDLKLSESHSIHTGGEDTARVCFSSIMNDAVDEVASALESPVSTGVALLSTATSSSCDEAMLDTNAQALKSKSTMLVNQERDVADRNITSSTAHQHCGDKAGSELSRCHTCCTPHAAETGIVASSSQAGAFFQGIAGG